MNYLNEDLGKLILRVSAGGLMFLHGIHKVLGGHDFIKSKLVEAGLPEFLALGVPVGEVLAPALLIVGLATRTSALIIAFTMLMSIYLVFADTLFVLNKNGGLTPELNLLFLFSTLAIFFLGAGRYAIDSKLKHKF